MNTNKAQSGGFSPAAILRDLSTAWRLLWDPRVPAILKFTLPVFAAVYWFFPLDLLPGIVLDDMAVVRKKDHLRHFGQLAQDAQRGRSAFVIKLNQDVVHNQWNRSTSL